MDEHYEELCDEIDCGILSGDSFHNTEAVERMQMYLDRWERQLTDIRKSLTTPE